MPFGPTGRRFRNIAGNWGGFGQKAYATLTTALTGTNNDITYTSVARGTGANSIRIRYVVAGASTPLTVTVAGNDITVNVATNGASAATSTGNDVRTAVNANATAAALVSAANATGNDGTGVVTALAYTNLAGGTDWTIGYGGGGLTARRGRSV